MKQTKPFPVIFGWLRGGEGGSIHGEGDYTSNTWRTGSSTGGGGGGEISTVHEILRSFIKTRQQTEIQT